MAEEKEYKTEPLQCWEEAKELRRKYYQDFLKAKEKGGIRVSGSAVTSFCLPAGLGEDVYLLTGEPYSATSSYFTNFSFKCLEEVERAGIARDLCSYMRNYWGSVMLDKYILTDGTIVDGWPKADFLLTSHQCCCHAKWYQYASELEGGIPLYGVDVPIHPHCMEISESRLNYIVQQLLEAIPWMEKITGREYNDELLFEAIQNEISSNSLWGQITTLNQAIPAPLDEKTMFSLYVFNNLAPHKKEMVDFYLRLRDEIKDKVEKGVVISPIQKYRIITDSQPPWAFLQAWRYLEREYGVISVGSMYSIGLQVSWDIDEKGDLVPIKTLEERNVRLTNREEALRTYAEFKLKRLTFPQLYSPLIKNEILKKIVRQWKVNAALIHLNRGCEGAAVGQMENRLALQEMGIPVFTFEGNMGDGREFDLPRTISRLDTFMEGLGIKKLKTS